MWNQTQSTKFFIFFYFLATADIGKVHRNYNCPVHVSKLVHNIFSLQGDVIGPSTGTSTISELLLWMSVIKKLCSLTIKYKRAYLLHMHSLLLWSIWSVRTLPWMIFLRYRHKIEWNTKMRFWGCQDNCKYTFSNAAWLLTFSQQHPGRTLWRPETWESQYLPFQRCVSQSVISFHCIILFCVSACYISQSLLCTCPFQLLMAGSCTSHKPFAV